MDRLMTGWYSEGAAIGDDETLVRLATEAGLEEAEVRAVLDSDDFGHEVRTDLAAWIFRTYRPHLLMLHIFATDEAQHTYGPGSPEALAAIERADANVKRMLDAIARREARRAVHKEAARADGHIGVRNVVGRAGEHVQQIRHATQVELHDRRAVALLHQK